MLHMSFYQEITPNQSIYLSIYLRVGLSSAVTPSYMSFKTLLYSYILVLMIKNIYLYIKFLMNLSSRIKIIDKKVIMFISNDNAVKRYIVALSL